MSVDSPAEARPPRGLAQAALAALLTRPSAWWGLLRLARLARRGWWRRPPFLPRPDPALWVWRSQVVYGRVDHLPAREELAGYVDWLGRFGRWARR
jgi:hypothetical protein